MRVAFIDVSHSGYILRVVGNPSNLDLRKRKGVAKLAFNDVGLAGLVEDVDAALRLMRPALMLFAQVIFREVSEGT